jgi:hypothetical protein
MTNANTNAGNLNPLFHPAAHYASPEDVLNDNELSTPEKRIILSSWASDMFAVESCPTLREIPGMGRAIRLADIIAALRRLDGDDDDPPPSGGIDPDAAAAVLGRRAREASMMLTRRQRARFFLRARF